MTIQKALDLIDELKPSQVEEDQKIAWLSQLDERIFREILCAHEKDPGMPEEFTGYTPATDRETELLAPAPYDEIYRFYLEMQIDLANMEIDKYNNSMLLYNNAWNELARMWRKSHMPLSPGRYWRF